MKELQALSEDPRVLLVDAHQCPFGLTTSRSDGSGEPAPCKETCGISHEQLGIGRAAQLVKHGIVLWAIRTHPGIQFRGRRRRRPEGMRRWLLLLHGLHLIEEMRPLSSG